MKKNKKRDSEQDKVRAKAISKYLRISPRKVRLVLDTIRRKPVNQARYILGALNKKAARMAEKVLNSAVANAKVLGLDENRLIVSDVRADGGPVFKRFMSRSQGRADRILKRTTHLSMIVEEGKKSYGSPAEQPAAAEEQETKTKVKKKAPARKKKAAAAAK